MKKSSYGTSFCKTGSEAQELTFHKAWTEKGQKLLITW